MTTQNEVYNEINEKLNLNHIGQELFEHVFGDLNSITINKVQAQVQDSLESLRQTINELNESKSEMDPDVYQYRYDEASENRERSLEIRSIANYLDRSPHKVQATSNDFFNFLMSR